MKPMPTTTIDLGFGRAAAARKASAKRRDRIENCMAARGGKKSADRRWAPL